MANRKTPGGKHTEKKSSWGQDWIFYKAAYYHTNHYPLNITSIIPWGFASILILLVFMFIKCSIIPQKHSIIFL